KLVPLHFIQNLTVKVNGRPVVEAQISQRREGRQDRGELARQPGRDQQHRSRDRVRFIALGAALAMGCAAACAAQAQDSAKEIQRYRQMIA
ncbi:MAG: hypothetical protein E6H57_15660, partial [Betaproteobacteria bacterium]